MRNWGRQAQRVVFRRGHAITFRKVTRKTGPNPAVNPPVIAGAVTVAGNTPQGAAALTLAVAKVNSTSFLKAGDQIAIAGDSQTYTVTADTLNTGSQFVSVPISPALAQAAAGGAAVTLTYAGDTLNVPAALQSYPLAVVAGGAVTMGDMRVTIAVLDLPGITPTTFDLLIDGATVRTIVSVSSGDSSVPVFWQLQAR